jgi:ribosome-binding factor A
VTGVKVDRQLAYADIYVSALEGSIRAKDILAGLEHAQGFLRHELIKRIELRFFPRLRFRWDATYERADRIEQLIASMHSEHNESVTEAKLPGEPGIENGNDADR